MLHSSCGEASHCYGVRLVRPLKRSEATGKVRKERSGGEAVTSSYSLELFYIKTLRDFFVDVAPENVISIKDRDSR